MDVHPILDDLDNIKPNLWYVLSPSGEAPSVRVGHTCTYLGEESDLQSRSNSKWGGSVLIIGGANPDGPFDEVYILELDTIRWNKTEWKGLSSRYEHSAFIPGSSPHSVLVFGGAQQSHNLNDIQILDKGNGTWSNLEVNGEVPMCRTCHSMPSIGDRLYVFGGGHAGPDPVQDQSMHIFDAVTKTWTKLETDGDKPSCRHGHVMVAIGTNIYLHGGMAGTSVFDDLYQYNTVTNMWSKLIPSGNKPEARTAHAGTTIGKRLFIFGGMSGIGSALDDFYVLNTEIIKWDKIEMDAFPPNPRLDHAMCTVTLKQSQTEKAPGTSSAEKNDNLQFVLIFGGMDTQGKILNDCLVYYPAPFNS